MRERKPAPEQRLHSLANGPCLVIQQRLYSATMVEPLHGGQHEIALLLWAGAMSRRPAAESFGSKAYHRRPAARCSATSSSIQVF